MQHGPSTAIRIVVVALLLLAAGAWYAFTQLNADDGHLRASGTIEVVELNIKAESGGRVIDVAVGEGDPVEAGAVLVQLDTELLLAQLAQLEAQRDAAQANYDLLAAGASDEDLALAEAQVAVAAANPELVSATQMIADLYESHGLTVAMADQAVAQARDQLEFADDQLAYVVAPDIGWYEDQLDLAQDALTVAEQTSEMTDLSELLGGVQAAQDKLDDMQEIYDTVKAAIDSCEVSETNSCDPTRQVRVDRVPWTLDDASDALNDAKNAVRLAELRVEQARIGDDNSVEAARDRLEDAQEDLDWALGDPNAVDLALAEANLSVAQQALAEAQRNYDDVVDSPDPDALALAEARLGFAQANVAAAEAQRALVEAQPRAEQLAAASAQVDAVEASIDLLRLQIARQTLSAPTAGVVLARTIEPGELAFPGATLLTIGQLDNLTITVYVPEDRYGLIRLGQTATLTVDSFPGETFEAEVIRIANQAEYTPRNVQTAEGRALTVYAIELRVGGNDGMLKPGMPADVDFGLLE